MTRPSQKKSERQTLDAVLAALGLRPDQDPEAGEAPDFTMVISGRVIGLEIMCGVRGRNWFHTNKSSNQKNFEPPSLRGGRSLSFG
jgi:hypothetical protein